MKIIEKYKITNYSKEVTKTDYEINHDFNLQLVNSNNRKTRVCFRFKEVFNPDGIIPYEVSFCCINTDDFIEEIKYHCANNNYYLDTLFIKVRIKFTNEIRLFESKFCVYLYDDDTILDKSVYDKSELETGKKINSFKDFSSFKHGIDDNSNIESIEIEYDFYNDNFNNEYEITIENVEDISFGGKIQGRINNSNEKFINSDKFLKIIFKPVFSKLIYHKLVTDSLEIFTSASNDNRDSYFEEFDMSSLLSFENYTYNRRIEPNERFYARIFIKPSIEQFILPLFDKAVVFEVNTKYRTMSNIGKLFNNAEIKCNEINDLIDMLYNNGEDIMDYFKIYLKGIKVILKCNDEDLPENIKDVINKEWTKVK